MQLISFKLFFQYFPEERHVDVITGIVVQYDNCSSTVPIILPASMKRSSSEANLTFRLDIMFGIAILSSIGSYN